MNTNTIIPGEMLIEEGDIELNVGRTSIRITVANSGDRPIQVGSHYHFYETNSCTDIRQRKNTWISTRYSGGYCNPL